MARRMCSEAEKLRCRALTVSKDRQDDLPSMQNAKRMQDDKCEEIACFGDAKGE
jgi:hypothetical protein